MRDGVERIGFRDIARTVADLRAEGKTVLMHCAAAQSRTAAAAIAYGVERRVPAERARRDVLATRPSPAMNPELDALTAQMS